MMEIIVLVCSIIAASSLSIAVAMTVASLKAERKLRRQLSEMTGKWSDAGRDAVACRMELKETEQLLGDCQLMLCQIQNSCKDMQRLVELIEAEVSGSTLSKARRAAIEGLVDRLALELAWDVALQIPASFDAAELVEEPVQEYDHEW